MTKQVLILDDNDDNRKLLFYALMNGDYEIHQAERGGEAVHLMQQTHIDLALLDIELPDLSGLELAAMMRKDSPDTVLIMLSANDSVTLLEQARAIGAHAYVVKPFDLVKVLRFIRDFEDQAVPADAEMQVL